MQQHSRSPVLLVFGALAILAVIALAVVFLASGGDGGSEFPLADSVSRTCTVQAEGDVNVRLGPGYEYQRGWILEAGQTRLAEARNGENWFLISNGWVPGDVVILSTLDSCARLPEYSSPQIFNDDVILPSAVEVLRWNELFGETFATKVNGWTESTGRTGAMLHEGTLVLSTMNAELEAETEVAPEDSPSYHPLGDAFYTFDLRWISGESDAETIFSFQKTSDAGFQLVLGYDGTVKLLQMNSDNAGEVELVREASVDMTGRQVFGVLSHNGRVTIFLNGREMMSTAVDDLPSGIYTLALHGANAEISISRFVVKVPTLN